MLDTSKDSKLRELVMALGAGTAAAALLWLAGSPELSWLGYVAAGLAWCGDGVGCSFRRLRRSKGTGS